MPSQLRLLGRPVNLRSPPRRFQFILITILLLLCIIILIPRSRVPHSAERTVSRLSETVHRTADKLQDQNLPKLPKLWNPFDDLAHPPPDQADSSYQDTKWYSDLRWLKHPFSSHFTLDRDRTLLPPLAKRIPIYTFYDQTDNKNDKVQEAEHQLLLTWSRAWWAQGFKPIVLGKADARKNPLYERLERLELSQPLMKDVDRWLAWGHMRGGILANWLVLPMAGKHDSTLDFLRTGRFAKITRFKSLQGGILCGHESEVRHAVEQAMMRDEVRTSPTIFDSLPNNAFETISHQDGIAFYDSKVINSNYKAVADALATSQAAGLALLRQLINGHLHITWQESFPEGIDVLQPHPQHTSSLVSYAVRLAHDLIQCPDSPIPSTCPPNKPTCTTCNSFNSNLQLTTPETFENRSGAFLIGTVPHPYTFVTLHNSRESVDAEFIRRETKRDLWLAGATRALLGPVAGGAQRLPKFKESVAGDFAQVHSVWVTAEGEENMHRDWVFGFELANNEHFESWHGVTKEAKIDENLDGGKAAEELAKQNRLLDKAKAKIKNDKKTVDMVESWNLADAEAWRFVRAFATRRRAERLKWEEEEKTAKSWAAWFGMGT